MVLLLFGTSCSSQPASEPRAGDTIVSDSPTGDDSVRFYFSTGVSESEAREQAQRLIAGAGLEPKGIETLADEEDDYVRATVDTTIGTRPGLLRRTIASETISRLVHGERILLETNQMARLRSEGELVEEHPLGRTYLISAGVVTYAFSGTRLVLLVVLTLLVILLPYPILRWYVASLRGRRLEDVEKVHRLRRVMLVTLTIAPIVVLVYAFGGGALAIPEVLLGEIMPEGPAWASGIAFVVGMLIVMVGLGLSVITPIQPYYRELRDIEQPSQEARRRAVKVVLAMLGIPLLWIIVSNLVQAVLPAGWWRGAASLLLLLFFFALAPVLIGMAFGRGHIDQQLRAELLEFAHSQGLKVRDIRAIEGMREKHGNALIVGLLPRMKYIFVTDYLVDRMTRDELKAVIAHEIGHGKKHHLLVKLGVPVVLLVVLVVLFVVLAQLDVIGSRIFAISLIALPLVMVAGIILLRGWVGIRLEKSADDYACETVGLEPTVSALEKLAEINMAKRDPGVIFNLLAQHPGIEERVERLR